MRLLFTTNAMPSHYYPLQPLASAAVAAGHTVAVASGSGLAETVQNAGLAFLEAGVNPGHPDVQEVVRMAFSRPQHEQGPLLVEHLFGGILAERMRPDLERICADFRPDVIVSEVTESVGPMIAEARNLAAAIVLFGLVRERNSVDPAASRACERLRRGLGLCQGSPFASLARSLKLVFASRSYQPPNVAIGPDVQFFRPEEAVRGGIEPTWLHELQGKPLVYGTLGTVSEFNGQPGAMQSVIDAIGQCDVFGIVTCGRYQDPESFRPWPKDVRVEQFISQALILSRASAVIAHGGYGTTMGALNHGLPLVLTPLGADQPEHALRCQQLGLAEVVGPEQRSAQTVAAALQRVLREPRYAQKAREQRAELERLPSVADAVTALARHLERGSRERR